MKSLNIKYTIWVFLYSKAAQIYINIRLEIRGEMLCKEDFEIIVPQIGIVLALAS